MTEYGLTISAQKTKSMAFKGRDPVRIKIVIHNKITEQVKSFKYLGNISYEREPDIEKITLWHTQPPVRRSEPSMTLLLVLAFCQ
jgi:hypothetical protein